MVEEVRGAEFLVVGSGAGGGTLAAELAARGRQVVVVERGPQAHKVGTSMSIFSRYDRPKSREGVHIYRTLMAGGTTIVSCGNGVPCLEEELRSLGVDIHQELLEAADETKTVPLPESLLSDASKRIWEAASALDLKMGPMPKLIDVARCKSCGDCILGCRHNVKWTALRPLARAKQKGATVLTNTTVTKVLISGGRAVGVETKGPAGRSEIKSDNVIVAAGGIGTPVILQQSGIRNAGGQFFCDLFNVTFGVSENMTQENEPSMALVDTEFHDSQGFLISPYVFPKRTFQVSVGAQGIWRWPQQKRLLGIMTKIKDDSVGRVHANGGIEKPVTAADQAKLDAGAQLSRQILMKIGIPAKRLFVVQPYGAHPGGTAAIGQVVDSNLRTEVEGLYVCDASVLPEAPGYPPILTIVALAKRLAKSLA